MTALNFFIFLLSADHITFQKLGLNSDWDPYIHDFCACEVNKSIESTAQERVPVTHALCLHGSNIFIHY